MSELSGRECQTADWPEHKKNCGKHKVSKKLPGTAQDPNWAYSCLPDHFRNAIQPSESPGGVKNLGFGTPHPSRPHSPALQLQMELLTAAKDVDYFIFDDSERPIPFVLEHTWAKMMFRILRTSATSTVETKGLEAIAECLVKEMGEMPGLSRERILAQLQREYQVDVEKMVTNFMKRAELNGYPPGTTFLEIMTKNWVSFAPQLMGTSR